MAVAYDNSATNVSVTNNTTVSATVSVGALTNACGVVIVGWENSGIVTVSNVRLDASAGNPFTRLNGVAGNLDGSPGGLDIWRITGAALTNASHTFDVTMSGNTAAKFIVAGTFQGVDQTTPLAGFVSDTTDVSSPVAVSPTGGTANDLTMAAMMNVDGVGTQTPAVGANTTIMDVVRKETTFDGAVFIAGRGAGNAASLGFSWSSVVTQFTIGAVIKAVAASTVVGSYYYREVGGMGGA